MPRKKSPAVLDRDINESLGVPAWQRGLDMTESRRLAATLGTRDVEAKQRMIENQRVAALPSVAFRVHEGPSRTSNMPRGVSVDVAPTRLYSGSKGVARVLRSYGLKTEEHLNTVFVPVDRATDVHRVKDSIVEALRYAGYRV